MLRNNMKEEYYNIIMITTEKLSNNQSEITADIKKASFSYFKIPQSKALNSFQTQHALYPHVQDNSDFKQRVTKQKVVITMFTSSITPSHAVCQLLLAWLKAASQAELI